MSDDEANVVDSLKAELKEKDKEISALKETLKERDETIKDLEKKLKEKTEKKTDEKKNEPISAPVVKGKSSVTESVDKKPVQEKANAPPPLPSALPPADNPPLKASSSSSPLVENEVKPRPMVTSGTRSVGRSLGRRASIVDRMSIFEGQNNTEAEKTPIEKPEVSLKDRTSAFKPAEAVEPKDEDLPPAPSGRKTWSASSFRKIAMAVEKCTACGKTVYQTEKITADEKIFHKACLKCSHCSCVLKLGNYASLQGKVYCKPHFKQLFKSKGNYSEGFGEEKPTSKWAAQAIIT